MDTQKTSRFFKAARVAIVILAVCLVLPVIFALTSTRVFAGPVEINETTFPDAIFRAYVSENFDTDKDGILSEPEATAVTRIDITSLRCTSLEGIGYFPELQELWLLRVPLTSLDVSQNTKLTELSLDSTKLTSLVVQGHPSLGHLSLQGNASLTTINVSDNPKLSDFYLSGNKAGTLIVSGNPELYGIAIDSDNFTSATIKHCDVLAYVSIGGVSAGAIDISECAALESISVDEYSYGYDRNTIDSLSVRDCPSLRSLRCRDIGLRSLEAANCPQLDEIRCTYTSSLASLTVDDCPAVTSIDCKDNKLTILNLNNCTALEYLNCADNLLSSLDLSDCPALSELNCDNNQLTSFDVSNNPALEYLGCFNNQLTSLDVNSHPALKYLSCGGNNLSSLTVKGNPLLLDIECSDNQLTSLTVKDNPLLEEIYCSNNHLTSLDVSNNPQLGKLYCAGNRLTSIDLGQYSALGMLHINDNQLTSLDISSSPTVTVECANNALLDIIGVTPSTPAWWTWTPNIQKVAVPVHPDPSNPGSYLSDRPYPLAAGHVLTLGGTSASYNATTGVFSATALDTPVAFTTRLSNAHTLSGSILFVVSPQKTGIEINEVNFPSGAFRAYVSTNFDNDVNGWLSPAEADAVTEINLNEHIGTIQGVEHFPKLKKLYCSGSNLTSIDVSNNPELEYLESRVGHLAFIDVSNNPALKELACPYNNLTSLDVSNNPALTRLECDGNQLTSLDVSNNPALGYLGCSNSQLTSLDVSNNPELGYLGCSNNQLTSLDVSGNPALSTLRCDNNHLFDVTGVPPGTNVSSYEQTITIPVKASANDPDIYLSDGTYPLSGTHTLKELTDYFGQGLAGYNAASGQFTTDGLDHPFHFFVAVDEQNWDIVASGEVTFVLQGGTTPLTHTVTFVDFDGTELSIQAVQPGTAATPPPDPVRSGYAFAGWDKSFDNVTSDLTVTATYTRTYTVTFAPGARGSFTAKATSGLYAGDATPEPPYPATDSGWRFIGWDPAVEAVVTGDATYTAQWEQVTYTVSYLSGGHGLGVMPAVLVPALDTHVVAQNAFIPDPGWAFDGWNVAGAPLLGYTPGAQITVTKDIVLIASWHSTTAATTYKVTFVDHDGTVLKEQTVVKGDDATAPANPALPGHMFIGWDKAFTNVTSDITVTAVYALVGPVTYNVNYAPGTNGSGIMLGATVDTSHTYTIEQNAFSPNPGYTFDGWDATGALTGSYAPGDTITVTGNITLTARWAPVPTFTVTFVDHDGTVLKTQTVISGAAATAPANPTRPGWSFLGWDKSFANVTFDLTVTARYDMAPIWAIAYLPGEHGSGTMSEVYVRQDQQYVIAQNAFTPNPGYTFDGWDATGAATGSYVPGDSITVTRHVILTARWAAMPTYKVIFVDFDGTTLKEQTVIDGAAAAAPADPVRPGHIFTGWDKAFDNIT
ncbi:MAG: InlB B-repeat-containing protein, partial [Coriobacteriales bacterium]|nr:InlB B-repeat-containing protein [Coriobacteriales bacterium]